MRDHLYSLKACRQYDLERKNVFYSKSDAKFKMADIELEAFDAPSGKMSSLIKTLCAERFFEVPKSIELLAHQGTFSRLYRLSFPKSKKSILKIAMISKDLYGLTFFLEQRVMQKLESQKLPHIKNMQVGKSSKIFPWNFLLAEEIDGRPFHLEKMTKDREKRLLKQYGKLIASIHKIKAKRFGPISIKSILFKKEIAGLLPSWKSYIELRLQAHLQHCLKKKYISNLENKRIMSMLPNATSALELHDASLLHGDLADHNALVSGSRVVALLDWEDCLAGDPVFDIAYWGTFRSPRQEMRLTHLLEGYQSVKRLPKDFLLRYWIYYLRIMLSKAVSRDRFGYIDKPGQKTTSLRIQAALHKLKTLGV